MRRCRLAIRPWIPLILAPTSGAPSSVMRTNARKQGDSGLDFRVLWMPAGSHKAGGGVPPTHFLPTSRSSGISPHVELHNARRSFAGGLSPSATALSLRRQRTLGWPPTRAGRWRSRWRLRERRRVVLLKVVYEPTARRPRRTVSPIDGRHDYH